MLWGVWSSDMLLQNLMRRFHQVFVDFTLLSPHHDGNLGNLSQEFIFNIKSKQSEKVNCFGFFAVPFPQLVCSLMLTKALFLNDDQY